VDHRDHSSVRVCAGTPPTVGGHRNEGLRDVFRTQTVIALIGSAALAAASAGSVGFAARAPVGSKVRPIPAATQTGFKAATVKARSIVWFRNVDGAPHNAIGRGINSGTPVVGVGARFKVRAPKTPGRYSYICGVHTNMRGLLTVVT
jgi:plastocyanin